MFANQLNKENTSKMLEPRPRTQVQELNQVFFVASYTFQDVITNADLVTIVLCS